MKTTVHADQRARKRIGLKHAEDIFPKALEHGIKQNQLRGALKHYLNREAEFHRSTPIIYQGFVFWHKREKLITIIPLHSKWNKHVKSIKEKIARSDIIETNNKK